MVAVGGPEDTGIPDTWRFKLIYGFDGRGELDRDLRLPGLGTLLGSGMTDSRPTRVVSSRGPVVATFAAGSPVVAIDTSYGVDARRLFEVGDLIYSLNPALLTNGGGTARTQCCFSVAAIPDAGTIILAHPASAGGVSEIRIN
jgi:hypothetical protein